MTKVFRIALILGQDIGYTRGVMRGVQAFSQNQPGWIFRDGPPDVRILAPLREWKPHGIIAHLFDSSLVQGLRRLRVPIVNTTNTLSNLEFPLVEANHAQIGRMAAEYFLSRGFRHFGYFGSSWTNFSQEREAAFRDRLNEDGYSVMTCYAEYLPRPPIAESWKQVDSRVRAWLKGLPKPVAIFSSNDVPARELAEICHELRLQIPDQVALLGVDNDELECYLAKPALSSIALPCERIGFEAARILSRMLAGRSCLNKNVILSPVRIVTRQSTDTLAIQDRDVSSALSYIRSHVHENLRVETISAEVAVSRRVLERKFRTLLGRTVLAEIRRLRIELVKQLLSETDLAMPTIAKRSGFSGARRLAVVFRQIERITPTEFRRRSRLGGATQTETRFTQNGVADFLPEITMSV